jgi:hypothetical protein
MAKKRRRKWKWLVLLGIVALLVAGAFKIKLLKIPKCATPIQEEVDWPPEEPGFYEQNSSVRIRTLEKGGWSAPGTESLCNLPEERAADVVAQVPAEPRFLLYRTQAPQYEFHLYHSVEVPETGECVRVQYANRVEGLEVTPDENNDEMVWIEFPAPIEAGETFMLTATSPAPSEGEAGVTEGIIVRLRTAQD